MQVFNDKMIRCHDCGKNFIWTAEEQRFYFSKQLSQPKRCAECRLERKQRLMPDTGRWE